MFYSMDFVLPFKFNVDGAFNTEDCPWKTITHILHQNNTFGSRLRGIQGNITENSQHLILSPSSCDAFFFLVCFSFFFFNDEYLNLRCVVPRSVWLCCLVSVTTLKSYFTLHNAHFLSFSIYLFICPWQSNIIIFPLNEKEWNGDDKRRKKDSKKPCQLFHHFLTRFKTQLLFQLFYTRKISPKRWQHWQS